MDCCCRGLDQGEPLSVPLAQMQTSPASRSIIYSVRSSLGRSPAVGKEDAGPPQTGRYAEPILANARHKNKTESCLRNQHCEPKKISVRKTQKPQRFLGFFVPFFKMKLKRYHFPPKRPLGRTWTKFDICYNTFAAYNGLRPFVSKIINKAVNDGTISLNWYRVIFCFMI